MPARFSRASLLQPACLPCGPGSVQCYTTSLMCNIGFQFSQKDFTCTPCSNGTFKTVVGNHNCTACPPNAVCNGTDFSCDIGFAFNSTTISCLSCSNGTFNSKSTFLSCPDHSVCDGTSILCDFGFTRNENGIGCDECALGWFKLSIGNESCLECPSNSKCNSTGFECDIGYEKNGMQCLRLQQPVELSSGSGLFVIIAASVGSVVVVAILAWLVYKKQSRNKVVKLHDFTTLTITSTSYSTTATGIRLDCCNYISYG